MLPRFPGMTDQATAETIVLASAGAPAAMAQTASDQTQARRTALAAWRPARTRAWPRTLHLRAIAIQQAETQAMTIGATTVIAAGGAGSVRLRASQAATPVIAAPTAMTRHHRP